MSKNGTTLNNYFALGAAIVIVVFGGLQYWANGRINALSAEIKALSATTTAFRAEMASTTAEIRASIAETRTNLTTGLSQQTKNAGAIEERLREQVGTVAGTVTTLQKLSKTDPQLLAKYSKVFFLSENYAPARLTEVPDEYKYGTAKDKAVSVQTDVWPHLQTLVDDAKKSGTELFVSSGYRSFAEQKALKVEYRVIYGAGTANQFSADLGYSEHQLGTAVDFTTGSLMGDLDGFDKTSAYSWLLANGYRYGFILSYPKDNQYYVYEPWHWRFVGVKLATDLHNQGKTFYSLDQRAIDEYLINIFE